MKLKTLAFGLALGLAAAGCGSDDSGCDDAGVCPDSGVTSLDGGAGDGGGAVGTISSGKYKATGAVIADDGCKIDPMALVTMNTDMNAWLPVDVTGGTMKVGNPKGTPEMPSLGSGAYGGASFKLTRVNHVKLAAPSTCEYDSDVTSTITNDAIDSFGLGVVEKQMNRTGCLEPAGVPASCASTWSWRMVKAQ